jgi:hypothetical protein
MLSPLFYGPYAQFKCLIGESVEQRGNTMTESLLIVAEISVDELLVSLADAQTITT